MKVLIVKPTKNIKKIGEALVKKGYARNYLLPNGIAIRATAENIKRFEESKHDIDAKHQTNRTNALEIVSKIEDTQILFISQSLEDGKLFGSISAKQIAKHIEQQHHVHIKHENINLDTPIKNIGIHMVAISLHTDVSTQILVNVARSESEATTQLNNFKNSNKSAEAV